MRTTLCSVLFLMLVLPAFSQSDRGTITGTVTDPAGSVIPNAAITARNADTGAQYDTVTTPTGNYTLAQLPAGNYSINVKFAGFSDFDTDRRPSGCRSDDAY